MKNLHFLLENTMFMHLLKDLHIKILLLSEDINQSLFKHVEPKCFFVADTVQKAKIVYEHVKPDLVIVDIMDEHIEDFVHVTEKKSRLIFLWRETNEGMLTNLIALGVRYFIVPPFTNEKLLITLQESIYQITLEREVHIQKGAVRAILEFKTDLLFFLEDDEIVDCNTTFLRFFGCDSLFAYKEEYVSFSEHFVEERGYYSPLYKWNWLDECVEEPRKVKIIDANGTASIFLLRASTLPEDGSRFVVICTDITKVEEIERKQERVITMDPLTNIYNRYKFQALLAEEWDRTFLFNQIFSVIVFDLDDFASVNDMYGKDTGDLVLAQVAELISQHINPHDIFARWEGNTFILFVAKKEEREAFRFAEQLRFFIETKKFVGVPKITASFGVITYKDNISRDALLKGAHAAMKCCKTKGKNQVSLYKERK